MSTRARLVALVLVLAARAAVASPSVAIVVDATDADALGAAAHKALLGQAAHDTRITATALDVGFGDAPASKLVDADAALVDAEHQFHDMDIDAATASATRARDVFEAHLGELAARETGTTPLRDAQITLAKAKFFAGDVDGAKDALRRAFAIDAKLVYGATLFPKQMRKAVNEARMLFDMLGTGPVEIASQPPGADIAIDGKPTGAHTPTTMDVTAGPHQISLSMPEHIAAQQVVDVDEKGGKIALTLAKRTGPDVDARALTTTLPSPSPAGCEALAKTLGVDALVLVRIVDKGDGFEAKGQLWFAAREHGELGTALDHEGPQRSLDAQLGAMEQALIDELVDRRRAIALAQVAPPESKLHRFRRSKPFWYVVGGVAGVVVVGLGVGLGVGLVEARQRELANTAVLLGGH